MENLIVDKLYKRIEERGVVCLGLDTSIEYVPDHIKRGKSIAEALFNFNKEIIDEFFEDIKKEVEEERNENYVSSLNNGIDKFDTTVIDFSETFKKCKQLKKLDYGIDKFNCDDL